MYLFQKVEEVMVRYHDARHTVAAFVLKEQENLYKYTIHDIAQATYTSKATVTRFAKVLGYHGWKDFIQDFVKEQKHQEMNQGIVDVNFPFNEEHTVSEIAENIKKLQTESLEDTMEQIDYNMVNRAVNYLLRAHRIAIFGGSPNIYLGELFRRKLLTIGKQAEIVQVGEVGITSYGLGPKDCAVIISYAGNDESVPYLHCVKTLLAQKVSIIGITSGGNNYLREKVDCVLTISSRERLYTKISNFATEESVGYLLNVLFSCCFARNYQENADYKVRNSRILESGRSAALKEMQE